EMTDALIAIEEGRCEVRPAATFAQGTDLVGYDVKTTTGDVLRVGVRPSGNEHGEGRVKLESVVDDGVPLPRADRLMIRFDLEGSGETSARTGALAALDLQFGDPRKSPAGAGVHLNKRIHGVLLDDEGQPVV